MLTHCSLLHCDIFRPRIRTRLYFVMCPLVLSKAIELSLVTTDHLVTLWQVRTCSIAVCLSLPSHSWFPSSRVRFFFFCRTSYRKSEHADSSQSVLESQRVKNQSFSCKISTNYEQPRQSVVESQRIKSCWKSRGASNSSCIFLERDPYLRRATKIVATKSRKSDRQLRCSEVLFIF